MEETSQSELEKIDVKELRKELDETRDILLKKYEDSLKTIKDLEEQIRNNRGTIIAFIIVSLILIIGLIYQSRACF